MKIMIIGGGGREHAMTHTFARQGHRVWAVPGNAGIDAITEPLPFGIPAPTIDDHESLIELVKQLSIDLTVVGPEQPLAEGIADRFQQEGLMLFGPTADAARLESQKAWSKEFMRRHAIPTAAFELCRTVEEANRAVNTYFDRWGGVVVKPSGLTAGKGVVSCHSKEEAAQAIKMIMEDKKYGEAGDCAVVEELLIGTEISILAFSDGKKIVSLIPSQDHKKLGEGGEGPNTGGIGAYAPPPFVNQKLQQEIDLIVEKTNQGLQADGIDYRGVIYLGLMVTARGIFVLEYNCRFGDPEAQVVLPLMQSDLAEAMVACCKGDLDPSSIEWSGNSACCVVMVAEGYPFNYPTGDKITGLEQMADQTVVFHAGTKRLENGDIVTSGGRVLGVTGIGSNLIEAKERAYAGVKNIDFVSAYYRNDIAYRAFQESGHEYTTT